MSFSWLNSCDIDISVRLKISHLETSHALFTLGPVSLHVVAQLYSGGELLTLDTSTSCSEPMGIAYCSWGETLAFSFKYRDLPPDSLLALKVYRVPGQWQGKDADGRGAETMADQSLLGGTMLPLFSRKGRLKAGSHRLIIHEGEEPDVSWPSSLNSANLSEDEAAAGNQARLEHLVRLYNRGELPRISWLDSLTASEIKSLDERWRMESATARGPNGLPLSPSPSPSPSYSLVIELPTFPQAVLYHQPISYTAASQHGLAQSSPPSPSPAILSLSVSKPEPMGPGRPNDESNDGLVTLIDTELGRDNPAELKAQKLARSLTRGMVDRDLKPNSDERKRITAVLKLPPHKLLHADERALLWRFRYALTQEPRALTKFLKCVDWSDAMECRQAADLMLEWTTIDVADALELLSPDFRNPEVRAHAVNALRQKEDEEILSYLLQLVQALRYELTDKSPAAEFLVERARSNPHCAVMLHWYLFSEVDDPVFGPRASAVYAMLVTVLQSDPSCNIVWEGIRRQQDMRGQLAWLTKELKTAKLRAVRATQRLQEVVSESGPLSELLTIRVPLPLDPSILLSGLVPSESFCFKSAQLPIKLSFKIDPHPTSWSGLASIQPPESSNAEVQGSSSHTSASSPSSGKAPLPLMMTRTGIVTEGSEVRCVLIYKKGDDLRQDQFILQMIGLMDRLLKRENLDLRMTPYKVLPMSIDDGLVEFVPSVPLSKILSENRSIQKYLSILQSDPNGPMGLKPEVMENFVRSCAGYCVATYILGVGDRHLDNLMLTIDGHFFHIDFAYILGNDPKPFPPPMKIIKEMVELMGGQSYVKFRLYCCEAFNILRKNADLILSLFHLMAGASIETIRQDPEKAILKLQDKLRLDLTDEQAVSFLQQLINDSVTAFMPQVIEATHRIAMAFK